MSLEFGVAVPGRSSTRSSSSSTRRRVRSRPAPRRRLGPTPRLQVRVRVSKIKISKICKICKFCKFLAGSFSAVSKRDFARKHAFDNIFQALQDLRTFAPLQSQNFSKKNRFEKSAIFVFKKTSKNFANVAKFAKYNLNIAKFQNFQLDFLLAR